jgi:flagellar hook-associated protein 3 FlgL
MPRISTFAPSQSAIMDLMNAQRSVFDAQKQLATGKRADDLKGVGYQAEALSAAYAARDRALAFEEAATRTEARLEIQDVALERISDALMKLRVDLTTANPDFIMDQATQAFNEVRSALGARHAGAFVFSGTRSDTDPVGITDITDLVPLASAADAFQNSDRKAQVQVDTNIVHDAGPLANDVATDAFGILKRIAEFDAGAGGPFSTPDNAAQTAVMQAELQNIITAIDNINDVISENGALQSRVETERRSLDDRANFLTRMIGDMEDIDMAEAATRFEQARTAVDVSARTFSTLSQVSLLNFLR